MKTVAGPCLFLSCLAGVQCAPMLRLVTSAEATLKRVTAPRRPAIIPITYLRICIPLHFAWATLTAVSSRQPRVTADHPERIGGESWHRRTQGRAGAPRVARRASQGTAQAPVERSPGKRARTGVGRRRSRDAVPRTRDHRPRGHPPHRDLRDRGQPLTAEVPSERSERPSRTQPPPVRAVWERRHEALAPSPSERRRRCSRAVPRLPLS